MIKHAGDDLLSGPQRNRLQDSRERRLDRRFSVVLPTANVEDLLELALSQEGVLAGEVNTRHNVILKNSVRIRDMTRDVCTP